jgi:hypothetical protein
VLGLADGLEQKDLSTDLVKCTPAGDKIDLALHKVIADLMLKSDKVVVTKAAVQTRVLNVRVAGSSLIASSTRKLLVVALHVQAVALSYVPLSVKFRLSCAYDTIVAKYTSAYDATTHTYLSGKATLAKYVDAIRSRSSAAATEALSRAYAIARRAQETGLSYVPAPVKRRSFAAYEYIASKAAAAKGFSSEKIAFVQQRVHAIAEVVKDKAAAAKAYIAKVASQPKVQTSAKSAVGGAVALGVAGGATGLTTGAALGVVVGLVPAIFTFGLSIPIGAAIGGGTGMFVGSALGGATGFVGGGVVGLKKDEIKSGASSMMIKANGCGEYVMDTAKSSKEYVKVQANVARARIVGTTGGTETSVSGSDC